MTSREGVAIVPFRDEFAPDFDRLNREWLARYFTVEPLDEEYLRDPRGKILAPGGGLFVAIVDGEVVGTCGAVPEGDAESFELIKLAVAPRAQGRGLGRLLVERVVLFARERGGRRLVLWTASKLGAAVRIYETTGFIRAPFSGAPPYNDPSVDLYMTLELGGASGGA